MSYALSNYGQVEPAWPAEPALPAEPAVAPVENGQLPMFLALGGGVLAIAGFLTGSRLMMIAGGVGIGAGVATYRWGKALGLPFFKGMGL